MFKLTYDQQGQRLKSKTFEQLPEIKEVQEACGNLISFGLYDALVARGWANGFSGQYKLEYFTIPTVKQLQNTFVEYFKVAVYEGQRFGQYVYNVYKYEVGNSYNEVDADIAYKMLFESITQSLDEVVEGDLK